jgi:cation transport regulator ChaC
MLNMRALQSMLIVAGKRTIIMHGFMDRSHISLLSLLITLYFAYGSNMDLAQMSTRCPTSSAVMNGELREHRFMINADGVATVVADLGSAVHGRLWQLSAKDERALDRYEGVARGIYKKSHVEVIMGNGEKVSALIYISTNSRPGNARQGYMEKILSAARQCGLPRTYIEQLGPWLPAKAPWERKPKKHPVVP